MLGYPVPPGFVEARGGMHGLVDKLYMRKDHIEHSLFLAIIAWCKKFSTVVNAAVLEKILRDDSEKDKKGSALASLTATLSHEPTLSRQLRGILSSHAATAAAEGTVAAGAVINKKAGVAVPDLDDQYKKEHTAVVKSGVHTNGVDATATLVLSGIAGDLARQIPGQKYDGQTSDNIQGSVSAVVAAGLGASLYAEMATHSIYAAAQLQQIADAGERVDFITVGDGRVCQDCEDAEAGSPYTIDAAPSIPQHVGCRCWYGAAGAIS